MLRIAFDIGGTFTDFVLHNGTAGTTRAIKVLSTPRDPAVAVLNGLERLMGAEDIRAEDVDLVLHATTVATNAVLERKGARVGLITTEGFRDVIIIGRQKRYETYDLYIEKPEPLVQRRHVFEVSERVGADGGIVTPLDMASVDAAIDALLASDREAVAVCLLHAYANVEHERRIRARLAERAPSLAVSVSCEVSPKYREYERTSTTVANAYVGPVVDRYLARLETALADRGFPNDLFVMQSNGGLIRPALARKFPVRIIESGPAAGILMCAKVGRVEGYEHVITFDMGGTTAKLGAIDDGKPAMMPTFEVDLVRYKKGSGLPLNISAVEMIEIGAGGGSIAHADKGMITIGPESAAADPGPICYGRGGRHPTITDANLVLGYISPNFFNGGEMALDVAAAERGIAAEIGAPLGLDAVQAAWGVHLIATSNMENATRVVSVERGRDPRRYAMVAFGGAGPLHAARMARSIGIPAVIIPFGAGVGSAIGLLEAEPRVESTVTRVVSLASPDAAMSIAELYEALEAQIRREIGEAVDDAAVTWSRNAQMRYAGQGFEIHVELPAGPIDVSYPARIAEAFDAAYFRRHRFRDGQGYIEAVDWTLVAELPSNAAQVHIAAPFSIAREQERRTRRAWFPEAGGFVETLVIDRQHIGPGEEIAGPAIIEDPNCTVVVPPGDTVRCSPSGHLLIEINRGSHG